MFLHPDMDVEKSNLFAFAIARVNSMIPFFSFFLFLLHQIYETYARKDLVRKFHDITISNGGKQFTIQIFLIQIYLLHPFNELLSK